MTKLHRLFAEQGQSAWLDNLPRSYLHDGTLAEYIQNGIRGVTANPTIFADAIEASDAYDEQFTRLVATGTSISDAYWELVVDDVRDALALLRPTFNDSNGLDGFVSIEVAPHLAFDTEGTIAAARSLHARINQPNLFVKIPATSQGISAIHRLTAEGRNINVTLIFSLRRYGEVIDAYLSGLAQFARAGGELSTVRSVASFFVSRVDAEVDRRLNAIGSAEALALRGCAAVAQAAAAYQLFSTRFSGQRWDELVAAKARRQRPLWASTSTKNPAYRDTLYVDALIGPETINTLPEGVVAHFEDHGTVARTIDIDVENAAKVLEDLAAIGIDMDDVGRVLEEAGVRRFQESFTHVLSTLAAKATGEASRT